MLEPTLHKGQVQRGAPDATATLPGRLICLALAAIGALAHAGETPTTVVTQIELPTGTSPVLKADVAGMAAAAPDLLARPDPAPLRLALDGPARSTNPAAPNANAAPPFKPPWLTGSDVHKFLGLGTLLAVGLTAVTAPGEGCEKNCSASTEPRRTSGTTHTRSARTAAALAGATVATGLLVHWDDFKLQDGFRDPDNQHVLLGLIGAGLMLYAVNKSMKSAVPTQHSAYAEIGGAAMAVAVKLTW